MSQDPVIQQFERLLSVLKNQRNMADRSFEGKERQGGDPTIADRCVPFNEKRVKDLRYSQQAKIHGNPWGLAKSVRMRRERLIEKRQQELVSGNDAVRTASFEAVNALAYALDAERLLGSFSRVGDDPFPIKGIDDVAENLTVWLAEKGYQITPISDDALVEL